MGASRVWVRVPLCLFGVSGLFLEVCGVFSGVFGLSQGCFWRVVLVRGCPGPGWSGGVGEGGSGVKECSGVVGGSRWRGSVEEREIRRVALKGEPSKGFQGGLREGDGGFEGAS